MCVFVSRCTARLWRCGCSAAKEAPDLWVEPTTRVSYELSIETANRWSSLTDAHWSALFHLKGTEWMSTFASSIPGERVRRGFGRERERQPPELCPKPLRPGSERGKGCVSHVSVSVCVSVCVCVVWTQALSPAAHSSELQRGTDRSIRRGLRAAVLSLRAGNGETFDVMTLWPKGFIITEDWKVLQYCTFTGRCIIPSYFTWHPVLRLFMTLFITWERQPSTKEMFG